jgi:hypothetical protein
MELDDRKPEPLEIQLVAELLRLSTRTKRLANFGPKHAATWNGSGKSGH